MLIEFCSNIEISKLKKDGTWKIKSAKRGEKGTSFLDLEDLIFRTRENVNFKLGPNFKNAGL